jgi:hypothetical protein
MVSLTASLEAGEDASAAVRALQVQANELLNAECRMQNEELMRSEHPMGYLVRDEQVIAPEDLGVMGQPVRLRECGRRPAIALGEEPQVHPDYSKG